MNHAFTDKRFLSNEKFLTAKKRLLQMHFESGVGHIGGNLSCLDTLLIIFNEFFSAEGEFILSKGHSAGALYIALWSIGRLDENDLKFFHKDETLLAGHPPASGIPEIPFATGSLGHGLSLAAGTALGFMLRNNEKKVVCLTSDGEWQEGSTWEALIFICHHQLSNLTILVDHNNLQGFGSTDDVASMSPLWKKLAGFPVDVQIINGHNHAEIRCALNKVANHPKIIILNTIKGHGVSFLANRMDSHYLPLSEAQYHRAIKDLDPK
jgi:transketolase